MRGCCCETDAIEPAPAESSSAQHPRESVAGRVIAAARWILPGAVLALLPKCPMCIVAYVAFATGIGISIPSAEYLRIAIAILCSGLIVYFGLRPLRRLIHL